jgi:hypothetical protein
LVLIPTLNAKRSADILVLLVDKKKIARISLNKGSLASCNIVPAVALS